MSEGDDDLAVVRGSGNVFRDLGLPNPDLEQLRAILAADGLASFPWRGRRGLAPDTRELVAASPYLLVYEVDEAAGVVSILRVWHGARDR